jgi:carbamate kinase
VLVAFGGNALLRRGQQLSMDNQRENVELACDMLAPVTKDFQLVLSHGNGPQVGLLALQAAAYTEVPAPTMDILGAESQAMIGHMISQELGNRTGRPVPTVVTQVEVSLDDPAWEDPTKFVGPVYTEAECRALAAEKGWSIKQDGKGDVWRRVVPSPKPISIVELPAIKALIDAGNLVIAGGGGGIPVVRNPETGALKGVEAVIDKDANSSLMAAKLGTDGLLMLTDGGGGIIPNFGSPGAREIKYTPTEALKQFDFPGGSMGPKVEAAIAFVEQTGGWAAIGDLTHASEIFAGTKGTVISNQFSEIEWY